MNKQINNRKERKSKFEIYASAMKEFNSDNSTCSIISSIVFSLNTK